MSAGWEVGDLALCTIGGPLNDRPRNSSFPASGRVYRVDGVAPATTAWLSRISAVGLSLADGPQNVTRPDGAWSERRFVKITPPAADEFDRETIALMNGEPVA